MSLDDERTYLVSTETIVLPGVSITAGDNATLLVDPNAKMNFHGSLNVGNDSPLRIMSSGALYSHSNENVLEFESVDFIGQNNRVIRNLKVTNCLLGLRISNSNDVLVTNVYLNSPYQSMAVTATQGIAIKNSCFTSSQDLVRSAMRIEHSPNTLLEKNIFMDNAMGVSIALSSNVTVKNNYFANNSIFDFGFDEDAQGLVEYNTFRSSNIAIDNHRGQMVANYNDIEANIGIYAHRVNASLKANYNNLNCSEYGIKSQCMYYNSDIVHLDCTRNYWNTTDLYAIMDLIYDMENESSTDPNFHLLKTIVDFQPISTRPNPAGVHNN
jgi:parallel beta-helix repeat protein